MNGCTYEIIDCVFLIQNFERRKFTLVHFWPCEFLKNNNYSVLVENMSYFTWTLGDFISNKNEVIFSLVYVL